MRQARATRLLTAAGAAVVALAVSGVGSAGGGMLALQVLPTVLAPAGSGVVVARFNNTAPNAITNVVIKVSLAGGEFVAAGSSARIQPTG